MGEVSNSSKEVVTLIKRKFTSGPMILFTLRSLSNYTFFLISILIWENSRASPKIPKFCQEEKNDVSNCEIKFNPERVTCKREYSLNKEYTSAKIVYFCSWAPEYINPEEFIESFPFVQRLTIRNGNVTGFLTDFPKSKYLRHLTLVDLNIRALRPELFIFLENLKFLDLSRNQLKNFPPEIIKSHPSLLKVILIDNPWNCSSDLKWMLDKSVSSKIPNRNLVKCGDNSYPGKPVHLVMPLIKKMERDCPDPPCSCSMNNIVWNPDQSYLIPVITVNCSARGLRDLPKKLPLNTTSLLLSRNNITDVSPLIRNKAYANIADIYLDYNKVESIDVLEGAQWLKTFRVLSVKGNELSQLPIYALDNAFEKNRNMAKVYLGNNPWKCDCLFIPDFQLLLIKYRPIIKDVGEIRCSEVEDDDNSNKMIATLSTNAVCRKPDNGINPLDVLSAIFASLIVLILGKLAYDCWAFRKTGKLPWIVAKMP